MELFKIKDLSFKYNGKEKLVLKNVNLSLNAGEFLLLVGENGSGKSTFLKLLKEEIAPFGEQNGTIEFFGKEVAYVGQNVEANIVTERVYSELAFALQEKGLTNDEISLKIAETASYFNLEKYFDYNVNNLSCGVKAILNIASAMVLNPDVLILDEPLSSLDPLACERLLNTLVKINTELGISIIIVEQRIEKIISLCDSVAVFENDTLSKKMSNIDGAKYLKSTQIKNSLPVSARIFNSNDKLPLTIKDAKIFMDKMLENKVVTCNKYNVSSEEKFYSISAKGISFTYDKNSNDVFRNLNYSAETGKINAIVGGNGSGKTTLLKVLSGVYKSYSGRINCDKKIALLPQNVCDLFTKETVREELLGSNKTDEVISFLNLTNILDAHPYDLSGGEMQKVAIGKLLLTDADIILMDEPTASLDSIYKSKLRNLLNKMKKAGKTLVIVSHDIEFLGDVADNCAYLFCGEIVKSNNAVDFFSNMKYYTTQTKIISDKYFENAINIDILRKLLQVNGYA